MPSIFPSSTTGKELKSCFANNASRSRSVASRVTVVTSRVMYWPAVHCRNRYISPPSSLSAYSRFGSRMAKSFFDPSPPSMREQATDRTFRQQVAGDPTVRPFPQPRVAVAAGGHQADIFVRDEPQQRVRRGCVDRQHSLGDRCDAMSGQVVGDVSQPRRGLISAAFRYFDDHGVLGLSQERQRILDGATGLAHILPGDGNSPGWERRYASRHNQDRPAGLEDKAAGIESPKRIPARSGIADDVEVGRPRLARDHIGLKPHDGSPFHAPAARPDGSAKLLCFFIEQGLDVPQTRRLRSRVVGRVFAKHDRDRRPARNSNQVGVEALGEIDGNADAAVQLALYVDVDRQRRIGYGSRSRHRTRMGFEFPIVRGPAQALRSSRMRFDVALQPTDLILELSARPLECIVESKMNVRMPLVQTWRTPDIDLLSVRER